MDSLTHVLVGAAIGQLCSKKPLNHRAALIGAFACTVPDFDVFLHSSTNPLFSELIHRSFSHSLIFIPFGALIISLLALLCFKSLRPAWRTVGLVSFLALASHGLLDACTAYGTQLLWPFSHLRVSWDIISIVDPVFTGILLIAVIWSWYTRKAKPACIGIILALCYLGFCVWQHQRAEQQLNQLIVKRHQIATGLRVLPQFGNIYKWDSLYIANNQIYSDIINTPLFGASSAVNGFVMPEVTRATLPTFIINTPELFSAYVTFDWFAQGYVAVVKENPYTIVDMRYLRKQKTISLWGVEFINDPAPHINKVASVDLGVKRG